MLPASARLYTEVERDRTGVGLPPRKALVAVNAAAGPRSSARTLSPKLIPSLKITASISWIAMVLLCVAIGSQRSGALLTACSSGSGGK